MPLSRVTIIGIGDSGEAQLLRALLEQLGLEVNLKLCGKPSDFFTAMSNVTIRTDATIISAHGDEDGIIFPEMAPGVDPLQLPNDRITPSLINQHAKDVSAFVLSLACSSGTKEFARAFSGAGVKDYMAPEGDPEGADVPLFVHLFFHQLLHHETTFTDALAAANGAMTRDSKFVNLIAG